jgi:hypothetical protein
LTCPILASSPCVSGARAEDRPGAIRDTGGAPLQGIARGRERVSRGRAPSTRVQRSSHLSRADARSRRRLARRFRPPGTSKDSPPASSHTIATPDDVLRRRA